MYNSREKSLKKCKITKLKVFKPKTKNYVIFSKFRVFSKLPWFLKIPCF